VFSSLFLAAFAAPTLSPELIDQLVSRRVVVVERQVMVELAVRTGDPLGSRAEGNLKTISEPKLVIGHKKAGMVRAGGRLAVPGEKGEVTMEPVGVEVKVTPVLRLDGKIQLECVITESEVDESRGVKTAAGFIPGLSSRTKSVSTVVSPGQRIKVRVSSRSDSDQTWVEVEANVHEPVSVK
jgi:hypothetical protein